MGACKLGLERRDCSAFLALEVFAGRGQRYYILWCIGKGFVPRTALRKATLAAGAIRRRG